MSRASAPVASPAVEPPSTDLDAVLADNAARLDAILKRWRREDVGRPLQVPLTQASEPTTAAVTPVTDAPPRPAARAEPGPAAINAAPSASRGLDPAPDLSSDPAPPARPAVAQSAPAPRQPRTALPAQDERIATPEGRAAKPKPVHERARKRTASNSPASRDIEPAPQAPVAGTLPEPVPQPAPLPDVGATLRAPTAPETAKQGELWQALIASKRTIKAVGWYSCVINVLMLTGPLFMLQVYDRVMTSGSVPTLVALLGLTTALYGIIGLFELYRSRIITRVAVEIDQRIGDRIFEASLKKSIANTGSPVGALRELDTLRTFVAGPAPMTFFDAWWTPVYLLVIFAAHWTLGIAATIGAALLLYMAWLSDMRSRAALLESQKTAVKSLEIAETGQRNAEVLMAMGMIGAYRNRWQATNRETLAWQIYASDRLGTMSSLSKTLRLLLQSIMLAIGAWLALRGEISSGAIIAATIIFGRALAPVEQVVTHWRGSLKAYESYKKLVELLGEVPAVAPRTALPKPSGHLEVAGLRVAAPGSRQLILSNIAFEVKPGQMLAVVGPSASGKSTLVRALVGIWPPFGGTVKIDGTPTSHWDSEQLGRHVGYLPQDTELFSGTVRDNISRFRADATDTDVVAAATAAHAHELITGLPKGYDTELGAFGTHLSGGQRQRIALARALYGNPALVVLDEPNANLDRAGDEALGNAIDGMRKRGQAIVLVSHRVQAIHKADTLLYLERGVQKAFGPRNEVMKLFAGQQAAPGPKMKKQLEKDVAAAASVVSAAGTPAPVARSTPA